MSKKIIGVTVGTTLPKPNFKQTDPTKGDYIKNKLDENDAMLIAIETGLIEPIATASGDVLADKDGNIMAI